MWGAMEFPETNKSAEADEMEVDVDLGTVRRRKGWLPFGCYGEGKVEVEVMTLA
jgi:hypothetical protein